MKSHCKECPHIIRNRNNDIILDFSRRHKKPHNCHMTEGKKDLWNVKDRFLTCYGSKFKEKETLE